MLESFSRHFREYGILLKLKTYKVNGKLITLLTYYLWEHYQRVVLNGQTLSWELVKSGVTQGSESWTNLESNFKIFIIFYKVFDKLVSLATLNRDLKLINNWAFQWKMQFNPDWNKQAQESYFSKKLVTKDC